MVERRRVQIPLFAYYGQQLKMGELVISHSGHALDLSSSPLLSNLLFLFLPPKLASIKPGEKNNVLKIKIGSKKIDGSLLRSSRVQTLVRSSGTRPSICVSYL